MCIRDSSGSAGDGTSLLREARRRVLNHTPGAMLLGVDGNVIITHGKSDADAIKHSIHLAHEMARQGVAEAIGG